MPIDFVDVPGNPILRKLNEYLDTYVYFVGPSPADSLFFVIRYLSCLWQWEREKITIHSAGIVHKGKLILFGGPSGAGKRTVSKIYAEQGDFVLDEDQLLIRLKPNRTYVAQAWGYSLQDSDVP